MQFINSRLEAASLEAAKNAPFYNHSFRSSAAFSLPEIQPQIRSGGRLTIPQAGGRSSIILRPDGLLLSFRFFMQPYHPVLNLPQ